VAPGIAAVLATSGPASGDEAPLALKILTGALVLGSGAAWLIAPCELDGQSPTIA
jgi:hypothetical protein